MDYPKGYKDLSEQDRARIVNGCGPRGWIEPLVPDKIFSIDLTPACDIHDYEYHMAMTTDDLKRANRRFLKNMVIIIKSTMPEHHNKWNRKVLYGIAHQYYWAVVMWGPVFWKPKEVL